MTGAFNFMGLKNEIIILICSASKESKVNDDANNIITMQNFGIAFDTINFLSNGNHFILLNK